MDTESTATAPARPLNLRQAAKLAKVSEVTLRKHLQNGAIQAAREQGKYGPTWVIEYDALAEFVKAHYGRRLSLRDVSGETAQAQGTDTVRALREQLDATLVDLGRYRQLAESTESTAAEVERILKERIAELQQERDAAREKAEEAAAERARLKSRGFWSRLFGAG